MEAANLENNKTSGTGELVLQNSRQAGTRRTLAATVTFIGRAQNCDVRLNVDGVDPLHCVLFCADGNFVLRDLNSVQGTFVNGVRGEQTALKHGDLVKIGPFHFRFEFTRAPKTREESESVDEIRSALRVQAAAIAAQQTALDEEEIRLDQQKSELQQQEEQLAAHLAEKQRQVQLWTEYTKAERETLRNEKLEQDKKFTQLEEELLKSRQELAADHEKLTLERQHINKVYQRLRQRWQRQWAAEKEKHKKLTEAIEARQKEIDQKQLALNGREATLNQDVLRFNAERELGLRRLKEDRQTLTAEQEAWRKRRSLEMAALKNRRRELAETDAKVTQVRALLAQEKNIWDRQQAVLQKELHGLNNRIVHQRAIIKEQEEELTRLHARRRQLQTKTLAGPILGEEPNEPDIVECEVEVVEDTAPATREDSWQERCDQLDRLAGALADQRALLVEQYNRLAEIQENWQRHREIAVADLDALAQRLATEEKSLVDRQQQTAIVEKLLRDRQAEIDAVRIEILAWREQLQQREQAFQADQQAVQENLRRKEALVTEQLAALTELRQRWNRRRQQEIEQVQADRKLLERDQTETHERRVGLFEKAQQLAEENRVLAEKSLALEQYRQEVFFRSKDPAAQRRIERLRRRWLSLNAAMIANAKNEREITRKELARVATCDSEVRELLEAVALGQGDLARKQAELEEREAVLHSRQLDLEKESPPVERHQPDSIPLVAEQDDVEVVADSVFGANGGSLGKAA